MQSDDQPLAIRRGSDLPSLSEDQKDDQDLAQSPTAVSPTSQEPPPASTTIRRPRLSHRSRAGCWTCRGRKVKCDEQRPRCGQCLRLNRECDWDHRWNFNHATSTTQSRHTNVTTTGSLVWDPHARPSGTSSLLRSTSNDNLPAFATLTNDDDRERKARSAVPGTYSVVVTPESFANLPEYASSGSNSPAPRLVAEPGRLSTQSSSLGRRTSSIDTNTIVLEQFEDLPPQSATAASRSFSSRSSSLPGGTLYPATQMSGSAYFATVPPINTSFASEDDKLSACFNQYLIYRLIPWVNDTGLARLPNLITSRDFIQQEAGSFPPLRSAIDALSSLHLCYSGQERLATAVNYYDQALATQTPLDPDEALSDGNFLRHFLLYVYDVSIAAQDDPASTNETSMSARNLDALSRLAIHRFQKNGGEKYAYVVWLLCLLALEACFMGNGQCSYIQELLDNNVMPSLARQVHNSPQQGQRAFERNREAAVLVRILEFKQGVMVQLAKLSSLSHDLRQNMPTAEAGSQDLIQRFQAAIHHARSELKASWSRLYPEMLDQNPLGAAMSLPPRLRTLLEHTIALYGAGVIYSHTSMFPRQRSLRSENQGSIDIEIEACKDNILSIGTHMLATQQLDQRWIIFPVFMAGVASKQSDAKVRALEVIRGYEGSGVGQNTTAVRKLLTAVMDEQSERVSADQPMEDVDWHAVATEMQVRISNCGL